MASDTDVITDVSTESLESRYKRHCFSCLFHRYLYYVCGVSVISDQEYDMREKDIEALEKEHPELLHLDSPTQTPGSGMPYNYPESIQKVGDWYYDTFFRVEGVTGIVRKGRIVPQVGDGNASAEPVVLKRWPGCISNLGHKPE